MAIIDSDDRVVVPAATDTPPYSAYAQVISLFPDGTLSQGTATMISPYDLLTSAHDIYDKGYGGYAEKVQVIPGRMGDVLPYGIHEVIKFSTKNTWRDTNASANELSLSDYGVITVNSAIGYVTGWIDYAMVNDLTDTIGSTFSSIGYPTDKGGELLHVGVGTVDRVEGEVFYFEDDLDVMLGQGGSPLIVNNQNENYIVGLVSDQLIGTNENGVLAFSKTSFDVITQMLVNADHPEVIKEINPAKFDTDIKLATQIVRFAEFVYDIQPGYDILTLATNQIAEVGLNPFVNDLIANNEGFNSNSDLAAILTKNLGLSGIKATLAENYLITELEQVPSARGEYVLNVANAFSKMTAHDIFGSDATNFNAEVTHSLAYSLVSTHTEMRTVEILPVEPLVINGVPEAVIL
jgi:V8-like Glu-specific endopeptidase